MTGDKLYSNGTLRILNKFDTLKLKRVQKKRQLCRHNVEWCQLE